MITIKRLFIALELLILVPVLVMAASFTFNINGNLVSAKKPPEATNTPKPTHVTECFCHNIQHNPVTICTADEGLIDGHQKHVDEGKDSLGECGGEPEPTVTGEPEPTITETPCEDCEPTPTEVEPTRTEPTPTQGFVDPCAGKGDVNGQPCGWHEEVSPNTQYNPPVCSVALPAKPTIRYGSVNGTTFKVFWEADDTNTTGWSLQWGYSKDSLPYGALGIPKEAREFTIGQVLPNTTRWVELGRWNGPDCVVYSERIDP